MNVINSNKNNDIFFVLRHTQRLNKNDALNFTNLDFNMTIPRNNSFLNSNNSYNEDIEISKVHYGNIILIINLLKLVLMNLELSLLKNKY